MYARVARFDFEDADEMRKTAEQMNSRAQSGPPEGVPAKAFKLLIDPEGGHTLAIAFFDTEEDLRTGDEALNAMDPPTGGMGQRVSVESYEVAVDVGV